MPASSSVSLVDSASSSKDPRPGRTPCSVSPTPAITMPLLSMRRASRTSGVLSPNPSPSTAEPDPVGGGGGPAGRADGPSTAPGLVPAERRYQRPAWPSNRPNPLLVPSPTAARFPVVPIQGADAGREGTHLRPRDRHHAADPPRSRAGLGGHERQGRDRLLRPGQPRGARVVDRELRRLLRGAQAPARRLRRRPAHPHPGQPRGGDGLRRGTAALGRADRRVLLAPRQAPGVRAPAYAGRLASGAATMIASGPLPWGTIGKTLACGSTCTSTSAGPSTASASARASSRSARSWTVVPGMP